MPKFTEGICVVARNVEPRVGNDYSPLKTLVPASTALDSRCFGAVGYNVAGVSSIFAGTSDKLFRLSGATPTDVSGDSYSMLTGGFWQFALFGKRVIATNGIDPPQSYLIGTDSVFSDLSADAPKSRVVATVKNFVMFGHTTDDIDGEQEQRVRWSAFEDPTSYPQPGSNEAIQNQSDFQDLFGDYGRVMAIKPGLLSADAIILQERAVTRVIQVTSGEIFAFDPIEGARGTSAPNSPVTIGGRCYYLGEDGFYVTDGATTRAIGEGKIDRWFQDALGSSEPNYVFGAADPSRKLIIWSFPSSGSINDQPDMALIYNWFTDEFTYADAWTMQAIFPSFSFSRLVDDVPDIVDEVDIAVDDRFWIGGRQTLAFFDQDNQLAVAAGPNAEAELISGDVLPSKTRGSLDAFRVLQLWPLIDGGNPRGQMFYRDRLQVDLKKGPEDIISSTGFVPTNVRGRWFRARVRVPETNKWDHLQGFFLDARQEGTIG